MTRRVSYPSDEVARHGAVEMARTCEAGLLVCVIAGEDGKAAVHFSRFGSPPDDDGGDVLVLAAMTVDRLLAMLEADL